MADSPHRFVALLGEVRTAAGLTYRQLERRAARNGDVLPYSTIFQALRRDRLPREELLTAYLHACGCPPEEVALWCADRSRLADEANLGRSALPIQNPPRRSPTTQPPSNLAHELDHRQRRRQWHHLATALALIFIFAAASGSHPQANHLGSQDRHETQCAADFKLGDYGPCVQKLQQQLQARGLELPADAAFGPYTRMRLTAFQVTTGIPPTGLADKATRTALQNAAPPPPPWPRMWVKQRLREVFGQAYDQTLDLVGCLSYGDPLWITGPDQSGIRRWGLFQYTDLELFGLRATPAHALDPEWNIQTAQRLWKEHRSFRRQCPGRSRDPHPLPTPTLPSAATPSPAITR